MTGTSEQEMRDEARRARGARAKIELAETKAAADAIEADIITAWKDSKDPAVREELHARIVALKWVRDKMQGVVAAGQVAAASQDTAE